MAKNVFLNGMNLFNQLIWGIFIDQQFQNALKIFTLQDKLFSVPLCTLITC